MNTDEYRSPEYEEWLSAQACHGVFMGGYTFEEEAGAWAAWQASRAAVVVKLPDIKNTFYPNRTERARAEEAVWWCKNNIEAAGVRVAP